MADRQGGEAAEQAVFASVDNEHWVEIRGVETDRGSVYSVEAFKSVLVLRSSGSAAQNHEERCPTCAAYEIHHDWCFPLAGKPVRSSGPQGGEAAEVKAVARALSVYFDGGPGETDNWMEAAPTVIAALDAVRSSGSAAQVEVGPGRRPFDPSKVAPPSGSAAQNHEHSWQCVWRCRHCDLVQPPAARSPQDEDHEAGIEAALCGWKAAEDAGHTRIEVLLRRAIQDYLSRCPSPERSGRTR